MTGDHSSLPDEALPLKYRRARARAGPLAAALGPGPGSWAQECKKNKKDTLKYHMEYDRLNKIYAKIRSNS